MAAPRVVRIIQAGPARAPHAGAAPTEAQAARAEWASVQAMGERLARQAEALEGAREPALSFTAARASELLLESADALDALASELERREAPRG
jgi:hypothetical protein